MGWAEEEMNGLDLGDERLNKRAIKMLDCFSGKPTLSIPGACNGWAETQAAYRFFAQEAVECSDILVPHQEKMARRMREQPVVLCIEDKTSDSIFSACLTIDFPIKTSDTALAEICVIPFISPNTT